MINRNSGFANLTAGYLFPEIARRRREYAAKHPDASIISLGIGNTTEPLSPHIAKAMSEQLSYDLSVKLDDITCDSLKAGHLIDKENIKPVFLRMDSELADKKNK